MNNYFNRQPKGLSVLFATEMWERFGFWATQSLLILFMTKAFLFSDDKAYSVYGAFGALLFLTPVIGGYIADRILGYQKSIIFGGILLIVGYFLLAIAGNKLFYLSLAILICGNGFLKPNISTLVGTLYTENDSRRDTGFTIFYFGINVGSLLGVIICGYLNKYFGWYSSFAASGLAMIFGMLIFTLGLKRTPELQKSLTKSNPTQALLIYLGTLLTIILITLLLTLPKVVNIMLIVGGIILTITIVIYALRLERIPRNKLLTCIILIFFSITFWALYFQMTTSLTLFIERDVNHHILGMNIPASMFFSLNGFFILILTPVFLTLWNSLNKIHKEPSTPLKFALGILLIGLGYLVLILATKEVSATRLASSFWIVISYLLQIAGELSLSPIGLSMVTLLVPDAIKGMMMGVWFYAFAAAIAVAGSLAKLANIPKNVTDPIATAQIYGHAFATYAIAAIVIGVLLIILTPLLKRMMSDGETYIKAA